MRFFFQRIENSNYKSIIRKQGKRFDFVYNSDQENREYKIWCLVCKWLLQGSEMFHGSNGVILLSFDDIFSLFSQLFTKKPATLDHVCN